MLDITTNPAITYTYLFINLYSAKNYRNILKRFTQKLHVKDILKNIVRSRQIVG